jgi:hypothetical protein
MKKILPLLFSLYLLSSVFAGENEEFRAMWVVSWDQAQHIITPHMNPGDRGLDMAIRDMILWDMRSRKHTKEVWNCMPGLMFLMYLM